MRRGGMWEETLCKSCRPSRTSTLDESVSVVLKEIRLSWPVTLAAPSHVHLSTNVSPSSRVKLTGMSFSKLIKSPSAIVARRTSVATSAGAWNRMLTIVALVPPESKWAERCFEVRAAQG